MADSKIPNIIYSDGSTTIGFLESHQNFLDFKVENQYCIQNPRRFEAYQRAGFLLYLIDNGLEKTFLRYAILMVKRGTGKKTYWGMDDLPMDESGKREVENTLSPGSLSFINNTCNNLMNSQINCNKNMNRNRKNVVRLTESRLRNMIKESVRQVLRESEEEFDFETTAYDKNGNEIHEGDFVIWVDRETGRKTKYQVYEELTEDMVKLWNKYGECEAYPEDCILIKR